MKEHNILPGPGHTLLLGAHRTACSLRLLCQLSICLLQSFHLLQAGLDVWPATQPCAKGTMPCKIWSAVMPPRADLLVQCSAVDAVTSEGMLVLLTPPWTGHLRLPGALCISLSFQTPASKQAGQYEVALALTSL